MSNKEGEPDILVNDIQAKIAQLRQETLLRFQQRNEIATLPGLQTLRKSHEVSKKTTLKSDVKKTSMFVNKLRSINSEALTQCIRDVETLNLTLYISEIVNAILEISFKPTDVPLVVKLVTSLHKRYEDLAPLFLEKLKASTLSPVTSAAGDDQGQKKRRIQIRLLVELFESGVFVEEGFFVALIKQLAGKTKNEASTKRQVDLMGISTFVKYGSETILGFPTKNVKSLARMSGLDTSEIPLFLICNASLAKEMREIIVELYTQVCNELVKSFKEFKKKEKRSENDRLIHGSLSEQKQTELDNSKKLYERLLGVVSGLAESLGEDIPTLEEERDEDEADPSSVKGISVWDGGSSNSGEYTGPFGDSESRSFYEDLPDLLAMVPLNILGITSEQADFLHEQWRAAKESKYSGPPPAVNTSTESESARNMDGVSESDQGLHTDDVKDPSNDDPENDEKDDSMPSSILDDSPHSSVTVLIQEKLPECSNKAKCDEFCHSFCLLNSKSARKRLAQALARIPWGRGELVSSYARIVASMHRVFNDIAPVVLTSIQKELTFITKTKALLTSNQIDTKSRILRYLGELVKFNVAPPIVALKAFKAFLADFSSHNVDFMAALLESCGRYLYLLTYTHDKMDSIIDTMMRLRRSKFLDLQHQNIVDSAYFVVKPPDRVKLAKKELTTVQKYIRYLILERLCAKNINVDNIINSVRRLPFSNVDENVESYLVKYAMRVARQKYSSIGAVADLFSGIQKHRPNVVIKLIDYLYEEIYRGFDSPFKRDLQRMIGYVRLLGELYNYRILTSTMIFELLYVCINYGHSKDIELASGQTTSNLYSHIVNGAVSVGDISYDDTELSPQDLDTSKSKLDQVIDALKSIRHDPCRYDPKIPADIDSPTDLFRAQLIVELVNTVGEYYVKGQLKEKLNRFLTYFQRYLMCKQSIPLHIEFSILDMFDTLESYASSASSNNGKYTTTAFSRYNSLESVQAVIDEIEQKSKESAYGFAYDLEDGDEYDSGDDQEAEESSRRGNDDKKTEEDANGEINGDDQQEVGESDDEEDDSISAQELAKLVEKSRLAEAEDEEFEKAMRAMMVDSVANAAKSVGMKPNDVDRMAIPAVLPRPKNILKPIMQSSHHESSDSGHSKGVVFKMLARDGKGRVETRQVIVPETNAIVVKLQKSEEALRLERQKINEKILLLESMNSDSDLINEDPDSYGVNVPYVSPTNRGGRGGRGRGGRSNETSNGPSQPSNTTRSGHYARRGDDAQGKKVTETLNLDEFLAESTASEIRRLQSNIASSHKR